MFITAGLIFTCLLLYAIKTRHGNYWKKKKVAYETPLPLVGNMLDVLLLRQNIGSKLKDLYCKFYDEPFFGIWSFTKPQLVVRDPNLIKQILVKDFSSFCDRNVTCDENIDDFSGNMMFFMKNPKWKTIRTLTTPLFSTSKMKSVYPETETIARQMIEYVKAADTDVLDLKDICLKYVNGAICSIMFGMDVNSFRCKDKLLITISRGAFNQTLFNVTSQLLYFGKNYIINILKLKFISSSVSQYLKRFFLDVVEMRKSLQREKKFFIDFLVDFKTKSRLGDNYVVSQSAQFLLAGHETITSTVSLTLYELSLNKIIQKKLRAEICSHLEVDGSITYASLAVMNYLDKIIYETLRKYTVIPFLGRRCTKDYNVPHTSIVIEKGVDVIISLAGLHHDPKYFPNPEIFDPERFSIENIRRRHPYCYLPFGDGQRSCIGERMGMMLSKLAIVYMIKNFDIEICKETAVPLEFTPSTFTARVNGGIYVRFQKID